jgi:hypothetical protein
MVLAVEAMALDSMSRDLVMAALHKLVPATGFLDVVVDGQHFRLSRRPDGDVVETPVSERPTVSVHHLWVVPHGGAGEAEAMGRRAFEEKKPITSNPFPFNPDRRDERRLHWEKGWRASKGAGADDGTDY